MPLETKQWQYDVNRKRFDAETTIVDNFMIGCKHEYKRISGSVVTCTNCSARWNDAGIVWPIK